MLNTGLLKMVGKSHFQSFTCCQSGKLPIQSNWTAVSSCHIQKDQSDVFGTSGAYLSQRSASYWWLLIAVTANLRPQLPLAPPFTVSRFFLANRERPSWKIFMMDLQDLWFKSLAIQLPFKVMLFFFPLNIKCTVFELSLWHSKTQSPVPSRPKLLRTFHLLCF